jgi:hypothetical protein
MANAYKMKQQEDRKQAALTEARAIASKGNNAIARMKAVRGYQNAMGVDQRTAERTTFPGRWD